MSHTSQLARSFFSNSTMLILAVKNTSRVHVADGSTTIEVGVFHLQQRWITCRASELAVDWDIDEKTPPFGKSRGCNFPCVFLFLKAFSPKKKHDKTWQDTRTIFVEVRRYKSPSGNYNEWCISWGWRWWCLWWCRRNFGCDRGRSAVRPSFRIYMDLRIVDIAVAVVIDLNMWDHVGVTTLIDWYPQVVNSCIFFLRLESGIVGCQCCSTLEQQLFHTESGFFV